uniref:Putative secreted protein n=1 Tax=Anopheles darlingi TaxID=43151 RepID=A0A2M4DD47_ANODA
MQYCSLWPSLFPPFCSCCPFWATVFAHCFAWRSSCGPCSSQSWQGVLLGRQTARPCDHGVTSHHHRSLRSADAMLAHHRADPRGAIVRAHRNIRRLPLALRLPSAQAYRRVSRRSVCATVPSSCHRPVSLYRATPAASFREPSHRPHCALHCASR